MIKYNTNPVTKNTTSRDLEALSVGCNLQEKSVEYTQNAEYEINPDAGYDGLSKVNVSVDIVVPTVQDSKTVEITSNGETTIKPDSDYDVVEQVVVNTNIPLQEKTVDVLLSDTSTEILPDAGYTGITKLTVNHSPVESNTEFTATKNGKYTITPSEGFDATTSVNLDVNIPVEATKSVTITENGTTNIIPSDGYDSIEGVDVTVNVPSTGSLDISNPYVDFYSLSQTRSVSMDDLKAVSGWDTATDLSSKLCSIRMSEELVPQPGWFDALTNGSNLFYYSRLTIDLSGSTLEKPLFPQLEEGFLAFSLNNGTVRLPTEDVPMFPKLKNAQRLFLNTTPQNRNGYLNITGPVENIDRAFENFCPYSSSIKATVRVANMSNCTNAARPFGNYQCYLTDFVLVGLKTTCNISNTGVLSESSVHAIVGTLGDVTSDPQTLTFAATPYSYITDDEKTAAAAKGWTIAQS